MPTVLAGRGQVLVAEHGLEPAIGGDDGFRDELARGRGEALALGRRDGVRIGAEALEERAVFGLVGHLFASGCGSTRSMMTRGCVCFAAAARLQLLAVLVEEGGDRRACALEPGLVVGDASRTASARRASFSDCGPSRARIE